MKSRSDKFIVLKRLIMLFTLGFILALRLDVMIIDALLIAAIGAFAGYCME